MTSLSGTGRLRYDTALQTGTMIGDGRDMAGRVERLGCEMQQHSPVMPAMPSVENRGELLGGLPGSDRVVRGSPSV